MALSLKLKQGVASLQLPVRYPPTSGGSDWLNWDPHKVLQLLTRVLRLNTWLTTDSIIALPEIGSLGLSGGALSKLIVGT